MKHIRLKFLVRTMSTHRVTTDIIHLYGGNFKSKTIFDLYLTLEKQSVSELVNRFWTSL